MKKLLSVTNLCDLCLFFLGVYCKTIFTYVQEIISKCNSELFCFVCTICIFIVITNMKTKIESKKRKSKKID